MRPAHIAIALLIAGSAVVAQAATASPVAAIPMVKHWQVFSDPNEGAFQLEMPQGWKVSGGLMRRNALQYRGWASAVSPDGQSILAIDDPAEPSYVAPSPMLAAAGFHVGSVYNGGGGTTYIVAPYESGPQFAAAWGLRKLRELCTSANVTANRGRPDISQQINAFSRGSGIIHDFGEATFTCDKGGMAMTAYVFASTTLIRGAGQGGIWYGDTIEAFLAPSPVAGLAAGLLAHMVKSVRVNPAWVARQTQTNADVSRIAAQTNAAISDSLMRSWEEHGATWDRVMQEGSRARLGIDVYADPATGTQYTVANTHNYYWGNASGVVVGTDTDTPPGGSFTRLKRVPPQ